MFVQHLVQSVQLFWGVSVYINMIMRSPVTTLCGKHAAQLTPQQITGILLVTEQRNLFPNGKSLWR